MPILTGEQLRECLLIAQRIRICELESQIREAAESLRRADAMVRIVLEGAGASETEKLTAGAALAEPQSMLMRALIRPAALTSEVKVGAATADAQREAGSATHQGPAASDPAGSDPASPMHLCKVLPLRRDLGVRFKSRDPLSPEEPSK